MIEFSFNQAAQIVNGRLHAAVNAKQRFVGMTHDSRQAGNENLYAALPGERVDGHDFVGAAAQAGASLALVQYPVEADISQLEVDDVLTAMGQLAAAWREALDVDVVGITGSNGKTTVKNMLAAIVNRHLTSRSVASDALLATPGNYNNEIGLPLTLATLSDQHQFAILEMGCAKPGDIRYLAELARPAVGVVTNASAAHLKGLGSVEGVAETKGEMFEALSADDSAVINRDDRFFDVWLNRARPARVLSFGLHDEADVRLDDDGYVQTPLGNFALNLKLPGRHNQLNALAATAAAIALGIGLDAISAGLDQAHAEPGRLQQRPQPDGWLLIDDSYNANPASMRAAIDVLAEQAGARWLVIGDMAELADQAQDEHAAIGKAAREAGLDRLFAFGPLAAISTQAFGTGGQAFEKIETLIGELQSSIQAHLPQSLTCLIKGSRSMRMERVVAALNEHGAGTC
ncbi:MAG: UDP-N-acetylmuramoyl-tripeptide--D-alanyl-D-alanine ligase [Pseudomonadota bacterium]